MLLDLIRFEWRYHTRQVPFAAAALLFAGLGFALTATGFGPRNVHVNSPYSIAESLGLLSLAGVFIVAVFCAGAMTRDREYVTEELIFATPVKKRDFLPARFLGSFFAAMTAFSASVPGMLLALAMPWQEATRIGPIDPLHYVWPWLVMALPALLVAAVTLFAIAAFSRSLLASVVGAVAIYVFYFTAAAMTNSPLMAASKTGVAPGAAASLLDPFALSPFFEQTRYWSPELRNTKLIPYSGTLLLNRLIWIAVAAAIWTVTYALFGFRGIRPRRAVKPLESDAPPQTVSVPAVELRPSVPASLVATAAMEIRSSAGSVPFLLLDALWVVLAVVEMLGDVTGGEYGAAFYPETGILWSALRQPLSLVGTIVIIYFSTEIVWRERTLRIAGLLNATPARNAVFVIAKWIALCVLMAALTGSGAAAAVVIQISRGGAPIEPAVLLELALFSFAPLAVLAMAAVFIQTVAPQKYLGLVLVLLLAVYVNAPGAIGIEHPLLRFGSAPEVEYSAMNGFGHFAAPFVWLMALWGCVGALLLLGATARWRPERARRTALAAAGVGAVAAAIAAFVLAQPWTSPSAMLEWRAAYEKRYAAIATVPQPRVAAIRANVVLDPDRRRHRATGVLELVNDTATPIGTIVVSERRNARAALSLGRPARLTLDRPFATWRFDLERPLRPGERTSLRFDVEEAARLFDTGDASVVRNGSFLIDQRALPVIGYRRTYEIRDPAERRKRGLRPLSPAPDATDVDLAAPWVDFDFTLATGAGQTALTSGLRSGATRFRAERITHGTFVFVSARYAKATSTAARVPVTVWFDPKHGANVGRILRAATDSLRLFEAAFGPYPYRELRIVEVPRYWPFGGLAMPGIIYLSEQRAMLVDTRDPERLDLLTRRTAHEVAHQWWGHQVTPAARPGSSFIVESLAKYCELMVLQERYGRAAVERSLAMERDRYLAGRAAADDPDVPLVRATDQPWLYYAKGAIAMDAIRQLLGTERLNTVLGRFATAEGGPDHKPAADTLLRDLQAEATPLQRPVIARWLTGVGLP